MSDNRKVKYTFPKKSPVQSKSIFTADTRKHHLWEPSESLRPGAQGPTDHPRRGPKSGGQSWFNS